MENDVKLVHVVVVDGNQEMIAALRDQLREVKKKIPNLEFLITNDKVELVSLKYLLNELYRLYKQYKEIEEKKK